MAAAGIVFERHGCTTRLLRGAFAYLRRSMHQRLTTPELNGSVIPAGTYPSLMFGYETVGLYNFAVAESDLPGSLVYEIVRAVFENHEEMMEVHAAAASTVPKNFVHNTFLPYHIGAIGYYGNAVAPGVLIGD